MESGREVGCHFTPYTNRIISSRLPVGYLCRPQEFDFRALVDQVYFIVSSMVRESMGGISPQLVNLTQILRFHIQVARLSFLLVGFETVLFSNLKGIQPPFLRPSAIKSRTVSHKRNHPSKRNLQMRMHNHLYLHWRFIPE
jgi:hypothetical protein